MTNIDPRKIISALILIAGVGTAVYLGSGAREKTSKEKFKQQYDIRQSNH